MSNDHTTTTTPTLKRVPPRHYRGRPIFWHEPGTCSLLQSEPVWTRAFTSDDSDYDLREILIQIAQWCQAHDERSAILYLNGGHDAASTMPPDWYRAPLADSWRITSWRTGPMAVTYETLGLTVSVRVAASWFDEGAAASDIDTLAHAYHELQDALNQQFSRQHAYLLGTPAQTGLDLLEQSLPYGLELPILPDDLRETIQHNSPQGRNEVFTAPDAQNAHLDELDWLQCYDGKWMYAACLNHIPAGRYVHRVGLQTFDEWAVGFYHFSAEVPSDWAHIGLLPMWDTWDTRERKTVYPWQPGQVFEGWATGAELQLAQRSGWEVYVDESIIWPDAQKLNPLKSWRDHLVAAREHAEKREQSTDLDTQRKARLIATAIRHILIDPIGALARRAGPERHLTPYDQKNTIPEDSYNLDFYDEGMGWSIDRPLAGWAVRFQHPEISAMVWGRARARLAKFALALPVESLILARTDALWLDCVIAGLPANVAKPGEWRPKEYLPGPHIPAPRDTSDALKLMRQARGKRE